MKKKHKNLILLILGIIALTFAVWTFLFDHSNTLLRIISSICLILIGLLIVLPKKT